MILTEEQIDQNKGTILELLEETGRPGIDNLIEWIESTDFFQAPASTRLDFHGAHEGGLAHHSINVYEVFKEKNDRYDLGLKDDELVIASLLHDVCKADFYVQNILKSGNISESKPYKVKDERMIGHGEESLYLVGKHIDLTQNEELLIRWHMGDYDPNWEFYKDKVSAKCPAVIAFRFADEEASRYMELRVVNQ